MPAGPATGKVRPPARPARKTKKPTLGFGVPAVSDPHHFRVSIPRGSKTPVTITEHLGKQPGETDSILRASLDGLRWRVIRDAVRRVFNLRLKDKNLKTCTWKTGNNQVDRLLGKELCILVWAIEELQTEQISTAVHNWLALRPEERWWLFGMAAATAGRADSPRVGWRLALKHALGDVRPENLQQVCTRQRTEQMKGEQSLLLFDGESE